MDGWDEDAAVEAAVPIAATMMTNDGMQQCPPTAIIGKKTACHSLHFYACRVAEGRLTTRLDLISHLLSQAALEIGALRAERKRAWRSTHRHVKRGTDYQVLGEGRVQTTHPLRDDDYVTIYRDRHGLYWARPTSEFEDGRFIVLPPPPAQPEPDA